MVLLQTHPNPAYWPLPGESSGLEGNLKVYINPSSTDLVIRLADICLLATLAEQQDPFPFSSSSGGPANSVAKSLGVGRRIVLYHNVNILKVYPSAGQICAKEYRGCQVGRGMSGELVERRISDTSRKIAVQRYQSESVQTWQSRENLYPGRPNQSSAEVSAL